MYLNESDEDEKSHDPFTYDVRVYDTIRKVLESKNDEISKVYTSEFIDFLI
jgi:hypothetical protein